MTGALQAIPRRIYGSVLMSTGHWSAWGKTKAELGGGIGEEAAGEPSEKAEGVWRRDSYYRTQEVAMQHQFTSLMVSVFSFPLKLLQSFPIINQSVREAV